MAARSKPKRNANGRGASTVAPTDGGRQRSLSTPPMAAANASVSTARANAPLSTNSVGSLINSGAEYQHPRRRRLLPTT